MKKNPKLPLFYNVKGEAIFKHFEVDYNKEKIKYFFYDLKDYLVQKICETGTKSDISKLNNYNLLDSKHQTEINEEVLKLKLIQNNGIEEKNVYMFNYIQYPALYKIMDKMLQSEFIDLSILYKYYDALKVDNLKFTSEIFNFLTEKNIDELSYNNITKNKSIFTQKETKLSYDEYILIINEFFKLLNFKNISTNSITEYEYKLAQKNSLYLNENLLNETNFVKILKNKKCI